MSYKKEAANKLKFPLPFTAREGKRKKFTAFSFIFILFRESNSRRPPTLSKSNFLSHSAINFYTNFSPPHNAGKEGLCVHSVQTPREGGREEENFYCKEEKIPTPRTFEREKIPDFISTDACRVRREGRDRRLIFLQATIKTDRLKGELLVGRSVIYFLANRRTRKIKRVWFFFFRFSVRETVGAVVNFARNYTSTKFMRSAAASSFLSSKRIDLLRSNKKSDFLPLPPLCYNNGHAPDAHKKRRKV